MHKVDAPSALKETQDLILLPKGPKWWAPFLWVFDSLK
jgi:hypothetical protein